MPVRLGRSSTLAVVIVYGLVLMAGPFLHHDFACHENSRTHCTSCQISQYAQKVDVGGTPVDAVPRIVGRIELRAAITVETPARSCISDRAPPV
jgi:hypothetical protein